MTPRETMALAAVIECTDWLSCEEEPGLRCYKAKPTQEFWKIWRAEGCVLKELGMACYKEGRSWVLALRRDVRAARIPLLSDTTARPPADPATFLDVPAPAGLNYMPFQLEAVTFALSVPRCLLAMPMGSGKTVMSAGMINFGAGDRILIVCPASLRLNWEEELTKWLVLPTPIAVIEPKDPVPPEGIVILSYEAAVKKREELLQKWQLIVVDECHMIKNPEALRTQAVTAITEGCYKGAFLSGTPVMNRPVEVWPVGQICAPATFDSYDDFVNAHCDPHETKLGLNVNGAARLGLLSQKLRPFTIRRTKAEILPDLPEKRRQVVEMPISIAKLRQLEKSMTKSKKEIDEIKARVREAIAATTAETDPSKMAKAVHEMEEAEKVAFSKMSAVRKETSIFKVPYTVDHAKQMLLGSDEPLIVFAHHQEAVDGICDGLRKFGVVKVDGRDSKTARNAAVKAFQSASGAQEPRVFVGSISAAGVGLTLTRAATTIMHEQDWRPGLNLQAEDRTHRIGQTKGVLIQYLVLQGSLDATVARACLRKAAIIEGLMQAV